MPTDTLKVLCCMFQNPNDSDKVDKDKAPSPFEAGKKDVENGNASQSNGIVQNGLVDDDKGFK